MTQFIGLFVFFILAAIGMALALQFSKYKKRGDAGCCGGGHCDSNGNHDGNHSCYSKGSKFVDEYNKKV
ncbi:MAG: hypothetical protein M0P71_09190 [Melioribacteraceae bacterium]|nr:hypothetical protein [Melioribacteraceae bacterium]